MPTTIMVGGTIDGTSTTAALLVRSASSTSTGRFFDNSNAQIKIIVSATGRITGATGIRLDPVNTARAFSSANLDNAGIISAAQGPAILSSDLQNAGFYTIINRSTGTIGGITASFRTLDNAGTIDGGTGSAITTRSSNLSDSLPQITNSGTITSAGVQTISDTTDLLRLTNAGVITNTVGGTALSLARSEITNQAGGTISASGGTAIAASALELVNRGTITGAITTTGTTRVDSIGGRIDGDVRLGAGDDIVLATLDGSGAVSTGITGQLDGGGGTNELRIAFDRSVVLHTLPTVSSFQRIGVNLLNQATVTLAEDFTNSRTTTVSGQGAILNLAQITTTGPAFIGDNASVTLTNNGSISSSLSPDQYALAFQPFGAVILNNAGSITANGGNGLIVSAGGGVVNSGAILATGTAATALGAYVTNSGTIRSTGGTGVVIASARVVTSSLRNTGTVEGETIGVSAGNNRITNSGIIRSAGIGIQISSGQIENLADGIISGEAAAIATNGTGTAAGARINNAGRIIGDVNFAGSSNNRVEALTGGMITGNLYLGDGGDIFVTDVGTGNGFSGVSGAVSGGGNETILYRVGSDATASLAPAGIFSTIGYQLSNNAKLTLTSTGAFPLPLAFEGTGLVDLSATLAQTGRPILTLGAVDLVTRGSITETASDPFGVAAIRGSGSITNLGTIAVSATSVSSNAAILGPVQVTNIGGITVAGADAIRNARIVQNSGTITQAAEGLDARGVVGAISLTNDGTIRTGGDSVLLNPLIPLGVVPAPVPPGVTGPTLVNRGTIISSGGIAISSPAFAANITNADGALIQSGGTNPAIFAAGGTVIRNDGRIVGNILYSIEDGVGYAYDGYAFRKAVLTSPITSSPIGGGDTRLVPNLVDNRGTIDGSVVFGDAVDRFENRRTVSGSITLGGGDDSFAYYAGSNVTGVVNGGAGTDTIELHNPAGSASSFDGARYINFEALVNAEGTNTIATSISFDRLQVTSGRLIGLAGSTITAPVINLGTGATFGSAGTVNGNVAVAGTLSPGSSPGTMTVNGNVSLAGTSVSLFELTPTVSDQLLVSGTLTIASGATLTLTGQRPLTPGAALDLIVANGGISGTFTTVNKPATILGFLSQSANRIQLLGQFAVAPGTTPQTAAAIDYVNGLLVSGAASPALVAAVPSLIAGGTTNNAVFARLTPEAYASAAQISVENGLTLAKAVRTITASPLGDTPGLFSFVQGLGNWRDLGGRAAQGTSKASLSSHGVMGGLGIGTEEASLGAFVGYLDTTQRIGGVGARTGSDGVIAGLIGRLRRGGFDLTALLASDGGTASTRRTLAGSATATSNYKLRGRIADVSVSYALEIDAGWALKPEAGLTYIDTRRSGLVETGGGAFGLSVARRKSDATLVSGTLTLVGGRDAGATVHPWLSAGVRHQLDGEASFAAARFTGATSGFSALGNERNETLATVGIGIGLDLTPALNLFGGYRGEFGQDGGRNASAGLKLRF